MAQDIELCDYATINETMRTDVNNGEQPGTTPTEKRLLRYGILTLGVLCIIQAILNISLSHAFYSKEDTDQLPFNSSVIADMCKIDQSQQNSTELCSCCKNLLRRLLREYQALETERDLLRDKFLQLTKNDELQGSGSGFPEEFFF